MTRDHPLLHRQEVRALARALAEHVATAAEVTVLAGHPCQVMEGGERGEPDQQLPVLEERQLGVEGVGRLE